MPTSRTDQTGFAPGVPHLANLPFASLQTAFLAGFSGHLMNLPVFGSLHGAAASGAVAPKARATASANESPFMASSYRVDGCDIAPSTSAAEVNDCDVQ